MKRGRPGYGEARDALRRAAIRTVSRLGLRGLTYRAVAAEAGVSHGAVSHHFGSRQRLIEEALELSAVRAAELSSLQPRTEGVEDFLADLPEAMEREEEAQAFQFELVLESRRDPSLRGPIAAVYQRYQASIARELARIGCDEDPAFSRLVFAALDGLVLQQIAGISSREEVEESLGRLRRTLAMASEPPALRQPGTPPPPQRPG